MLASDELIAQLKLKRDTNGQLRRRNRRVEVWERSNGMFDEVCAFLDPPLDLGLRVHDGLFAAGKGLAGGRRGLDDLWVDGDEPDRVRMVLRAPLKAGLRSLAVVARIVVEDRFVSATRRPFGRRSPHNWHAVALSGACKVAAELDAWRRDASAPAALARQEPRWEELAREAKLSLGRAPLRLAGRIGSLTVDARTWRTQRAQHAFSIQLVAEDSLNLDLCIAVEDLARKLTRPFRRGRRADRPVGDPPFDDVFDVRTSNPGALATVVDAEVRASLLACLQSAGRLRVHDLGAELSGTCRPDDEAGVPELIRRICGTIERMHANLASTASEHEGPYR